MCRFAFDHFEQPARVLAGVCRLCRPGATIAIEDLYSSEFPERSSYYNHFERLRDHSHTRALALTELIAMLAHGGIELQRLYSDELIVDTDSWLQSAQTSPKHAAAVQRLLEDDMRKNLSGTPPFIRDGQIMSHQRTLARCKFSRSE